MSVLKTRVNGRLVELEDKVILKSDLHNFVAKAQNGGEYAQFSLPSLRKSIVRMFTYAVIDAAAPTGTEDLNDFFEEVVGIGHLASVQIRDLEELLEELR